MIRVVPTARKTDRPPALINDRYLLAEEIGKGRTANVHRAWDRKSGAQVALKLPIIAECLLAKEIFENEANALRQLQHPNVVQMLDYGESEFGRFIVMELIKGACLKDIIAMGRLDLKKRLAVLRNVCSALAAAHEAGIVHRDVKPRNIMVSDGGVAKLIDFGYANVREGFCCKHLRKERFGSPFYSAPELTRDSADPRLDIYSLGMMTFEMLLQSPALRFMSAFRMLELQHSFWHLKRQVMKGRIPKMAGELIEAATRRDPQGRAGSVDDFGRMLAQLVDEIDGS